MQLGGHERASPMTVVPMTVVVMTVVSSGGRKKPPCGGFGLGGGFAVDLHALGGFGESPTRLNQGGNKAGVIYRVT